MKKRCEFCNKKTGLIGFDCKCGNYYCLEHRYPEKHECKYENHKEDAKELLRKQNQPIVGDKIVVRV